MLYITYINCVVLIFYSDMPVPFQFIEFVIYFIILQ